MNILIFLNLIMNFFTSGGTEMAIAQTLIGILVAAFIIAQFILTIYVLYLLVRCLKAVIYKLEWENYQHGQQQYDTEEQNV